MLKKIVFFIFSVYALTGCVSLNKQPISSKSAIELKGQSVVQTKRKVPDFAAMTAATAMLGLVGAVAMIAEGNSIVSKNKIEDPAVTIATKLVTDMASQYSTLSAIEPISIKSDDEDKVKEAAKNKARYVLDVQTVNWSMTYFPADWAHYRVIYTAKAKLIDVEGNQVVAEGYCKHAPDSADNAPTYSQMVGNDAAVLKAQLSSIADNCVKTLKAEMLLI